MFLPEGYGRVVPSHSIYPSKVIYLAGPITGQSYEDAKNGWRSWFALRMMSHGHIRCASPMRMKDHLEGIKSLEPEGYEGNVNLTDTDAGITTRDHNDVRTADLVVACFLGADRVSIGTCVEFGWADAYRVPVIMVAEEDNIHRKHPILRRIAGFVTDDLGMAVNLSQSILTPQV